MALEIWHNPRCSKSRAALAIVQAAGVEARVRAVLARPPERVEVLL